MSAEATAWLYRHAPTDWPAGRFQVAHAIADTVSDLHGHEFWMFVAVLAAKARVSRRTATDSLGHLVECGLLEPLTSVDQARSTNAPRRYRWTYPDWPVVFDTRAPKAPKAPKARAPRADSAQPPCADPAHALTQDPHMPCADPAHGLAQDLRNPCANAAHPYKEEPKMNPTGEPNMKACAAVDTSTPALVGELIAPSKPRQGRAPDLLWEAVMDACGIDPASVTDTARGRYNRAVGDLRKVGATPGEVTDRAQVYRVRFAEVALTPSALASHWAECDPARAVVPMNRSAVQRITAAGRAASVADRARARAAGQSHGAWARAAFGGGA